MQKDSEAKVKGKVVTASFLKIVGRGLFVEGKSRERWTVEKIEAIRTHVLKHLLGAREERTKEISGEERMPGE